MSNLARGFWMDESGQDMAEYALLLALIALVLIIAIQAFRGAIEARFQEAADAIGGTGS